MQVEAVRHARMWPHRGWIRLLQAAKQEAGHASGVESDVKLLEVVLLVVLHAFVGFLDFEVGLKYEQVLELLNGRTER